MDMSVQMQPLNQTIIHLPPPPNPPTANDFKTQAPAITATLQTQANVEVTASLVAQYTSTAITLAGLAGVSLNSPIAKEVYTAVLISTVFLAGKAHTIGGKGAGYTLLAGAACALVLNGFASLHTGEKNALLLEGTENTGIGLWILPTVATLSSIFGTALAAPSFHRAFREYWREPHNIPDNQPNEDEMITLSEIQFAIQGVFRFPPWNIIINNGSHYGTLSTLSIISGIGTVARIAVFHFIKKQCSDSPIEIVSKCLLLMGASIPYALAESTTRFILIPNQTRSSTFFTFSAVALIGLLVFGNSINQLQSTGLAALSLFPVYFGSKLATYCARRKQPPFLEIDKLRNSDQNLLSLLFIGLAAANFSYSLYEISK